MPHPLMEIRNLHKSFHNQEVLRGIDLSINRGESVVIIGHSGCGKSVLIKHIIRLLEPDKGAVYYDNEDISQMRGSELVSLRRRIGMLFQSAALFDSMTVEDNVGLGLKESRAYGKHEIAKIVLDKLRMVNLEDALEKYPSELSGGMRKRVGLARAISNSPEVLLYDEPTTGLDPVTAAMIDRLIVSLNSRLDATSVTVTHDMKSAFTIGSRFVMLKNGKVEFDGSPEEILKSNNIYVKEFLENSIVNYQPHG